MRGRRLWCKFEACGGIVRAYVVKNLIEDGVECDGSYDRDTNIIQIEWKSDVALMKSKLLHELLHVCFKAYSADAVDKVIMGQTRKAREQHEEYIVSFLEPVLFDILARNNFLRIPKPPRPA